MDKMKQVRINLYLLKIIQKHQPVHGYALAKELKLNNLSYIYNLLPKLLDLGLIEVTTSDTIHSGLGRPRKFYSLTERGQSVLDWWGHLLND